MNHIAEYVQTSNNHNPYTYYYTFEYWCTETYWITNQKLSLGDLSISRFSSCTCTQTIKNTRFLTVNNNTLGLMQYQKPQKRTFKGSQFLQYHLCFMSCENQHYIFYSVSSSTIKLLIRCAHLAGWTRSLDRWGHF